MYKHGQAATQDYKEAVNWYNKAADQGYAGVLYNLGLSYYKGKAVPQNNTLAYVLFSLAAASGEDRAISIRESIHTEITPEEIDKGQGLVAGWKPGQPLPKSKDTTE